MTITISITVPSNVIEEGGAAEFVSSALASIGYVKDGMAVSPEAVKAAAPAEAPAVKEEMPEETKQEEKEAPVRERGKPSAGRSRRTKEEIAEDEAADAAEAAEAATAEKAQADPAEVAEQDKADEKAEVEANRKEPVSIDDVKAAVTEYVNKFGMPATQEDGPGFFVEALGTPPEGEKFWKMSILPTDQESLAKVLAVWKQAVEENPKGRK